MALKLGPAILIVISFAAILLGIILHAISIDEMRYRTPSAQHHDTKVVIDDKLSDLIWFLQITDLHLSNRGHFEREKDFIEFSTTYLDIVKPDAVLVTGDITDGREPNTTFGTGPQLDEWIAYSNAVLRSNASEKTAWLDIRGNHDNFNVYRPGDPNNLYRKYSIRGKQHARNYMHVINKGGKNYTFIGVDEVQTPGLKIPFNFLGIVKNEDLAELNEFKKISDEWNSQYRIWFAHYPTSSIASPNGGLRNIVDGPYLCGHFHTIGNLVTRMHATQQPGFVEVELGDWKYNRRIRLAAVDHQLFSLVDVGFKQFPIALMTNPKAAEHAMPKFEPIGRILNSTHIRVIAFSNATVISVKVSLDGESDRQMIHAGGPLYVLEWDPKKYSSGLHLATIHVTDSEGKSQTFSQSFSMDSSKDEFPLSARILLRAYFRSYVMAVFFLIVCLYTLPLLIMKTIARRHSEAGLKRHYHGTFLHSLHLLSNINRLFWPLFLIPIWLAIGPHFFGYLVDEAIGVCFVWGVLIDGTFIHTGITYNVASIFLLLIHIPITILITYQVKNSYISTATAGRTASIKNFKMVIHLALTASQLWMGSLLHSAYGTMSLITSFPFIWCILIYAFCWYQCTTITRSDFVGFECPRNQEERQSLTGQRIRDDKSSTSDHSTC